MNQVITVEKEPQQTGLVSQPMRLIEMAISNNADIEKLEKLMALQERWDKEQARKAYFSALSSMQAEMPIIRKLKLASFASKSGGNVSYNFASLDDICEQIKPLLQKFGFSYRFEQKLDGSSIHITCVVTHSGGHFESCSMSGGADTSGNKNALQQSASTVTYLRRYTLTGAFGIATADQDIDGRISYNDGMNNPAEQEMISIESEAWLTDHYNALDDDKKPKMLAWLKVNAICDLTEQQAQAAIKALKAKK